MVRLTLDKALEKRGKDIEWLAHQLKYPVSRVRRMAKGEAQSLRFDSLDRICKILECDIDDILRKD